MSPYASDGCSIIRRVRARGNREAPQGVHVNDQPDAAIAQNGSAGDAGVALPDDLAHIFDHDFLPVQ